MSDDERAIVDAGRGHLLTGPYSAAQQPDPPFSDAYLRSLLDPHAHHPRIVRDLAREVLRLRALVLRLRAWEVLTPRDES